MSDVVFLTDVAVAGVELVTLVALALLAAGVVLSVAPAAPGAVLSLAGVYLYWWASGYAEPSTFLLGVLTVIGVLTLAAGLFGDVVAAHVGGASTRTATIAGLVGFVLFFVIGPSGILVGIAGTVFVLEYLRGRSFGRSAVAAVAVVFGSLASKVLQVLLTGAMLVVMVLVILF